MATGLLFDCDEEVIQWQAKLYGRPPCKCDRALGLLSPSGTLIGAVFFQNWNGANIELGYHGKQTLSVGIVRCLARYVSTTFNPARLTVITSKRNRQLMKALQKLGFKLEGMSHCYYGSVDCNKNTGVRFVMFREAIDRIGKLPKDDRKCS